MFSYLALGAAGAGGGLVYLAHLIRKSEQDYALRRKGFCEDIIIPRTTMDENNNDVELYHNTDSYCSQVTRACLFQAGVDWKSHHIELHPNNDEQLIDGYMNQNLSQEFRKVNPWATVPVLVHNSHPIYESKEIMLYICEKLAPESGLIPEKPEEKLLMQRWIDEAYLSGIGTKTVGACIPLLSQPLFFDHMKHVKFQTAVYTLFNHPLKMRGLFQGGLWAAVNLFGLEPPKLTKKKSHWQISLGLLSGPGLNLQDLATSSTAKLRKQSVQE